MNWYSFIKKYVWDDNKTPYLVPVENLMRIQARHELFTFSVLMAIFFMMIGIAAMLGGFFHGRSYGMAFFAFTQFCSAVFLGATRHHFAAMYCSAAPVVALFYFLFYGFPPNLHAIDEYLILIVTLILLRYTFRVVAIAKAFPFLPADPDDD